VLAGGNRRRVHTRVQVVRRRVVNDLNVRIGDERVERPVRFGRAECGGLGSCLGLARSRHGDNIHEAKSPDSVHMMRTHEARAHNSHSNAFHGERYSIAVSRITGAGPGAA
jgi:hypothetical protein